MKKLKFRKILKLMLVAGFIITAFSLTQKKTTFAVDDSDDFADREEYYYTLCSGTNLSDSDKTTCALFRDYLSDKQTEIDDKISSLQDEIDDLKANIKTAGQQLAVYTNEITAIENQISYIQNSITTIEANIESLNQQIAERELKIENLNTQIKKSMVASQNNLRTNGYVKFIMGATSFVDLIRRITAINELTSYSRDKIEEMEAEKVLLQADIEELQVQKDDLVEQQSDLEVKQNSLEKLRDLTQQVIDEYQSTQQSLIVTQEGLEADSKALDEVIDEINNTLRDLRASSGFGPFVKNKLIMVTSGCYYYKVTSGGFHPALDMALLGYGTPVYPVANGYVMATGTGCYYDGGYLGNYCNGGAGNYVYLIVQIDNKLYTAYYMHLKDVNVSVGDLVYQKKTILGTTGNSGNSSGPHLHLSMIYLGTTDQYSIEYWVKQYKKYGLYLGLPYSSAGSCSARNNKAPCYMNPTDIYGYKYGGFYITENW